MLVWRKGTAAVQELADEMQLRVDDLVAQIAKGDVRRVPGTGVFVARLSRDIPPIVFWYLRHIRSLHESTVIVNVVTALVPYVAAKDRMEEREIAPRVWRAQARFGLNCPPSRAHSTTQPTLSGTRQSCHARMARDYRAWCEVLSGSYCEIRTTQVIIFVYRGIWLLR